MRQPFPICLGLCLLCGLAGAAPSDQRKATALIRQAEKQYGEGQYRESAHSLEEAHALSPNAKLLYNIARAYDQAGDIQVSLEFYRRYLGQKGADPSLVKKANLAIDRLGALVAKEEEAAKKVQQAEQQRLEQEKKLAEEKARTEEAAARTQREESEARQRAEAKARQESGSRGRTLSFVAGGVALAAAGTGVFFGLQAQSSRASFADASDVPSKQQYQAQTRQQALVADLGFGVAAAAAIAAVVAWPRAEEPKKELSISLAPSPFGAGLAGSF